MPARGVEIAGDLPPIQLPGSTRRVVRSLAPVVAGPEILRLEGGREGVAVEDLESEFGRMILFLPGPLRWLFHGAVFAFLHGARLRYGRPFDRLPLERRDCYFSFWLDSRVRLLHEVANSLRALLALGIYEDPWMQEHLGYDPAGWTERVARRRIERYGDELARPVGLPPRPRLPGPTQPGSSSPAEATNEATNCSVAR